MKLGSFLNIAAVLIIAFTAIVLSNPLSNFGVHAQTAPFIFTAAGDWNQNAKTSLNLASIASSGSLYTLALGDLSYSTVTGSEPDWCNFVKNAVGQTYPFELTVGNHENNLAEDGVWIDNYAGCLPDRLNSAISPYSRYGWEYYFDQPNLRTIILAADNSDGADPYTYQVGTNHYLWLKEAIKEAKTQNKWVIVGVHKDCITIGAKTCEIGTDLTNLLISEHVDLVLQGHDHNYQRSKQLTCLTPNAFDPTCVSQFDNRSGVYSHGYGTTFVIVGTGGDGLTSVNTADSEIGYFATYSGFNLNPSWGYLKINVTENNLGVDFIPTYGSFTDHFDIGTTIPTPSPSPVPVILNGTLMADATIKSGSPASNYGLATTLNANLSPSTDFLLKFQVSGTQGRTITNAKLRLYVTDPSLGSGGRFYRTADTSWIENGTGGVTWNNAPVADSVPLAQLGSVALNSWIDVDVSPLITGDGVYGLRVNTAYSDTVNYSSKEGSSAFAPQLILSLTDSTTQTPQPTNTPLPTDVPTATPITTPTPLPTASSSPTSSITPTPSPILNTLIIPVTADATIDASKPTIKFGTKTNLITDNSPISHFLMMFNVAGTSGRIISHAALRLYNNDPSALGGNFFTTGLTWSESTVTWNNAPPLGTFIQSLGRVSGSKTAPQYYDVDATSVITGDGQYAFRTTSSSSDGADYISKEGASGKGPQLIITLQ